MKNEESYGMAGLGTKHRHTSVGRTGKGSVQSAAFSLGFQLAIADRSSDSEVIVSCSRRETRMRPHGGGRRRGYGRTQQNSCGRSSVSQH